VVITKGTHALTHKSISYFSAVPLYVDDIFGVEIQRHSLLNSNKFDTRRERSASYHACTYIPRDETPAAIEYKVRWVLEPVWALWKREISSSAANGTLTCGCPARSLLAAPTNLFRLLYLYLSLSLSLSHTHTHTSTPLNGFKTTKENSGWKENHEGSKKVEKELYLFEVTWTSSAPPRSSSVKVKMFNGEH
jgi:hypothetical protein